MNTIKINGIEVKAVLWDVDGTIMNFFEAQKNGIRKCFASYGLGECSDELLMKYDSINHKYWKKLEKGEMTKPEILIGRFYEFFEMCGFDREIVPGFSRDYESSLGDTICYFDGSMEMVKLIQSRGIPQFAVTNGTKSAQTKKLMASGLDKIFTGIFISEDVGYEKPSPDFFAPVMRLAKELVSDITTDDMIIIGDSMTSDMQLGKNVGIKTCLFAPAGASLTAGINSAKEAGVDIMFTRFADLKVQ